MSENQFDFSVLLSLYKNENPEYLSESLASIAGNSLQPSQVVIVYDGPIDRNLHNVVLGFSDKLPIEIFKLNENVGLGKALNYGLVFCKNEIVFRMDTDDICLPERFEKQIDFIKCNPTVSVLGSAVEEFNNVMEVSRGVRFSAPDCYSIKEYSKKRNPLNHMSVVFKKSVVEIVGGYQHHHFMEDYNLWLRILAKGYVINNLPDVLVSVRGGDDMINRRRGFRYVLSEIKLARLKYSLKIDSFFNVIFVSFLRIAPRMLPSTLLKYVYKSLRH